LITLTIHVRSAEPHRIVKERPVFLDFSKRHVLLAKHIRHNGCGPSLVRRT